MSSHQLAGKPHGSCEGIRLERPKRSFHLLPASGGRRFLRAKEALLLAKTQVIFLLEKFAGDQPACVVSVRLPCPPFVFVRRVGF